RSSRPQGYWSRGVRSCGSADGEQVDDEDERATTETMTRAGRSIAEVRRDDELSAAADAHPRDARLPAGDQARERELDRLAAVPARIELLPRLVVDADVVHVDAVAGLRLVAAADLDVGDDELSGRGSLEEVDFGLALGSHPEILACI